MKVSNENHFDVYKKLTFSLNLLRVFNGLIKNQTNVTYPTFVVLSFYPSFVLIKNSE